jgi:hypothetical protein
MECQGCLVKGVCTLGVCVVCRSGNIQQRQGSCQHPKGCRFALRGHGPGGLGKCIGKGGHAVPQKPGAQQGECATQGRMRRLYRGIRGFTCSFECANVAELGL